MGQGSGVGGTTQAQRTSGSVSAGLLCRDRDVDPRAREAAGPERPRRWDLETWEGLGSGDVGGAGCGITSFVANPSRSEAGSAPFVLWALGRRHGKTFAV